ncbi:hypothetical protein J2W27_004789 [Variovorax boronicumulans]|uniref:phage head spike fiber domain-containing protein n=1 Tax=Variovorax boronicumulans TaxID=436515 RepID=UPI002785B2A8|nr:hypothetical protein [Variovorax boronicumulans]MDP9912663.1 hypothetical protein [Variovorax boronicumulans]
MSAFFVGAFGEKVVIANQGKDCHGRHGLAGGGTLRRRTRRHRLRSREAARRGLNQMTTTLTEKTFAELFTYAGGTNGSRVNAQGFIEPCATPRFDFDPITKVAKGLLIENARQNLLMFSSRFDKTAGWVRASTTPVPEAALAPNGRWDACKLILNNGINAGSGNLSQTLAKAATATTFAYSFYAKAAGSSNGWIYANGTTGSISIPFNLSTMIASPGPAVGGFVEVSKRVIDAGNGWCRVELVFTSDATTSIKASIFPGSAAGNGPGDGIAGIYVWGAQLEVGAFASSYIPSGDGVTARASIGSYCDAKGILRYAAAGVARNSFEPSNLALPPVLMVEEQRTNTLQRSSDMHIAPWTLSGATRTPGKQAPDGTLRATEVSGATTSPFAQNLLATATVMTYSIYVKNVSRTQPLSLLVRNNTTGVNSSYGYPALHGATPSITGAGWEMRPVGNGWFRCTYTTAMPIAVGDSLYVYAGFTGTTADSGAFQVWGAQLEAGAFATSYIPSTETFTSRASIGTYFDSTGATKVAASGVARMTYNPADLTIAPWLVQEGQSTNLVLQSDRLSVSPWSGSPTRTEAPEKFCGLPFWEIKKTAAITSEGVSQSSLATAAVGDTFTATCAVLAGTSTRISLGLYNGTTASWGVFAERTVEIISGPGTVTTSSGALAYIDNLSQTEATMVRITRTYTSTGIVAFLLYAGGANSATATDSVKVARVQVEPGAVATSYIPTTTATVTRVADIATSAATTRQADTATSAATTRTGDLVRVDTTKGWCNATEGTLFMEFGRPREGDASTRNLIEIGSAIANRVGIGFNATGSAYAYSNANGVSGPSTVAVGLLGTPVGSPVKTTVSYGADGLRYGCNGQLFKAAMTTVPPMNFLGIGNLATGGNQPFLHVRSVQYRPQKLTDAEVVALTA